MFSNSILPSIGRFPRRTVECLFVAVAVLAAARPVACYAQDAPTAAREAELLRRIEALEQRIAQLESRLSNAQPASAELATSTPQPASGTVTTPEVPPAAPDPLAGTTFNLTLDGYYGFNFNQPVGRVNLLRAYDVLSNSFSLNQASIVVERAPNVDAGRRFGVRLDLMYGQATETQSGNPANELRPQVYRPVYQAYGTYVVPVGHGLTVDFGKWASALGAEGNYTKDQLNYSRSYWFTFLPFYHFGFRSSYDLTKRATLTYWLVNGIGQSEDFNDFKSQALLLTLKPSNRISWNINYYTGIEDRDVQPLLNPGFPALPTQPGLSTQPAPSPERRVHIFDTYATAKLTTKLTLAGEGAYVTYRGTGGPLNAGGGAGYIAYQLYPRIRVAGRAEYLSDRAGLFSGVSQALKETTVTGDFRVTEGFLLRTEWRRDFSNQPFFLTAVPGRLKSEQNTATLGLIWWFGGKQGTW